MPKVLIVDDDENCRLALIDALEGEAFIIFEATGGEEALRIVAEHPPDVILLDVMMPGMDGVQVCHAIKQSEETYDIPVIMVTALGEKQDVLRGLKVGATDYVVKPFSGQVVRARVRAALRSKFAHDEVSKLASRVSANNRKLAQFADTAERIIDDVSHDFRSPLTVIQEFALIIADGLDGPVTAKQTEHLRVITSAVEDLSRMVDNLLDSSKLRAGSLRVDRRPQSVEAIFTSVRPIISSKARRKGVKFTDSLEPDLPEVFADKGRVGRAIVNLAVNAIKFSPKGEEVALWARRDEAGDIQIGITDHGRGLSVDELEVIFNRFTQTGDQSESAKGLGLGLCIVKELVGLNLGELQVASEPAQGSTFSFTLPTSEPAVILGRYFAQLARAGGRLDRLAALRVSAEDPRLCCEDMHVFLTGTCYPMDLVLDCDSGSLLVIGLTPDPDLWMQRLRSAWGDIVPDNPDEPKHEICIEQVGSWSYRQQKDSLVSIVVGLLHGSASYAGQNTNHR